MIAAASPATIMPPTTPVVPGTRRPTAPVHVQADEAEWVTKVTDLTVGDLTDFLEELVPTLKTGVPA